MTTRQSVYSLLVPDPGDTLAYTQYKQHKVETCSEIASSTGRAPTSDEMSAFERAAKTPMGIAMYQRRAVTLANAFLDATLESRKARLEAEFMTTAIGQQLATILAHQRARKGLIGWLKDVSANLSVNVLTILFIAALVFGYRLLDGWLNHLSTLTGVSSTEKSGRPALADWAGDPVIAALTGT
ncbi:hypothetical protein CR152_26570 [Massilia violaceinigra]|uniref:Uncharacterized protein n=1 Tax=Massilia violaceinigra TaxID=2045208 RepID=A0A2D2DRR6_9BURK|nr:hypothetical protein [Massilia violaceinigra]ATQ77671.1 hypothetical protein CR152_26570 [Massilia violaceinigra]